MQAEANATVQSAEPIVSKRNMATGVVVLAVLLLASRTWHGSEPAAAGGVPVQYSSSASFGGSVPPVAASGGSTAAGSVQAAMPTFHGYACTLDCSAHKFGYSIAKANHFYRLSDCPNAPVRFRSFQEGCWAAVGREGP
jgi:hypothetical protein